MKFLLLTQCRILILRCKLILKHLKLWLIIIVSRFCNSVDLAYKFIRFETMGTSNGGLEIPILKITNKPKREN